MKSYKKRFSEKRYPPCVNTENRLDPMTDFELLNQIIDWAKSYYGPSFKSMIDEMLAHSHDGSLTKEQYDLFSLLDEVES